LRVLRQKFQQIGLGHIRLVAHADEMGKAHLLAQHQVHHPAHHRAGLRHEADAARIRHTINEGGVQPGVQVDQPHAIGADHAHAVSADDLQALSFNLLPFHSYFLKSARDDDHCLHAAPPAGFQRLWYG